MRILYVTPWAPSLRSGGGRHCYANLRALLAERTWTVDYVGPEPTTAIADELFSRCSRTWRRTFGWRDKVRAAVRRDASSLDVLLRDLAASRQLRAEDYDLVFVESTRSAAALQGAERQAPRICSVHNVEVDYMAFNSGIRSWPARRNIDRIEEAALRAASHVLTLHDDDERRLRQLYSDALESTVIFRHPVCSFAPERAALKYSDREKAIGFVGSLSEPFNERAIMKFMGVAWPHLRHLGYTLIVAGSRPSRRLVKAMQHVESAILIADPVDMGSVLGRLRLLVMPDESGTGMKLRVAEALSLGVPVVGTKAALRGYERIGECGMAVHDAREIRELLSTLLLDPAKLELMSASALKVWQQEYGETGFAARLQRFVTEAVRP